LKTINYNEKLGASKERRVHTVTRKSVNYRKKMNFDNEQNEIQKYDVQTAGTRNNGKKIIIAKHFLVAGALFKIITKKSSDTLCFIHSPTERRREKKKTGRQQQRGTVG
jgi:hypothetical protein